MGLSTGRSAVLLDRDGVINRERGEHTWRVEDLELLPDVALVLRDLDRSGTPVAIISNQSGIGRGLHTVSDVEKLHAYLHLLLAEAGAPPPLVLYCPHHPGHGKCLCRKPGHLLVQRALALLGAVAQGSVFIGDRQRDVDAATTAGVRGVLVTANAPLRHVLQQLERLP